MLNFLVKIVIKNSNVKFYAFSSQNGSFIFPPKESAEKAKVLNIIVNGGLNPFKQPMKGMCVSEQLSNRKIDDNKDQT